MARKRQRNEILIERNIIEEYLMLLKELIRNNRKIFLYALAGLFLIVIAVISISVYIDKTTAANQVKFEKILKEYQTASNEKDDAKIQKTIGDLNTLIESSHFGFAHNMAYYVIANIYFDNNQYKTAKENYLIFADKSSENIFTELSLVKAAVAEEKLKNYDEALKIYKTVENDSSDSILIAQVYYNMASIYEIQKDYLSAKQYYNNIITSFPQSAYTQKAKKRIFLMAAQVK